MRTALTLMLAVARSIAQGSDNLVAPAGDVLISTDRLEAAELPGLIWVVVEPFA